MRYLPIVCLTLFSLFAQAQPALPPGSSFVEIPASRDLLERLRQGGYVLYLRHGHTDNSRADAYPIVDLDDCSTQRVLSDEGRRLMRRLGRHLRAARLPIGEIYVSPLCRTRESAELALDRPFVISEPLMYSANMTRAEKQPRIDALRTLITAPLTPGTNRLLIAHAPNLADLIGFFVKPEGTIVVFAQRGPTGFEYVASIPPELWPQLLP